MVIHTNAERARMSRPAVKMVEKSPRCARFVYVTKMPRKLSATVRAPYTVLAWPCMVCVTFCRLRSVLSLSLLGAPHRRPFNSRLMVMYDCGGDRSPYSTLFLFCCRSPSIHTADLVLRACVPLCLALLGCWSSRLSKLIEIGTTV